MTSIADHEPAGEPSVPPPPPAQPPSNELEELGARASTGAVWTIIGAGSGQVIRFISNLILTRLLVPEYFGLMALVNVLLMGLELFSDVGIRPALIQNKREDPGFVNTVWTTQVIRGAFLCLFAIALAEPLANFYDEPILASLTRVMSIEAACRGFISTSLFTEERHLRLKGPALVRLTAHLAGAVAMVGYAWATGSVWSLVLGGLVGSFVETVLSHLWLSGTRNRFWYETKAARSLFSFGVWVFLGTIFAFIGNQSDRLVLGKVITMSELGVYSIALMLAKAPVEALARLSGNVLFPLYTLLHYSSHNLAATFDAARRPLLIIGGWVTSGVVGGGPTIIRLLYDSRYWEGGWILQAFSGCLFFGMVVGANRGAAALAVGRSDIPAAIAFSKVVGILVMVPIGFALNGATGAILGFALSELVRYVVALVATVRLGFDARWVDFRLGVRVGIGALLSWATTVGLSHIGVQSLPLHAFAVFCVATILWAGPLGVLVNRVRSKRPLFSIEQELASSAE